MVKVSETRGKLLKEAEELEIPTTWIDDYDEVHDIPNNRLSYAIKHYKKKEIPLARKGFAEATDLKKKGILK
jgi:hypothetical protein